MDITLRLAAPSDAAKLIEIYRPYVEKTTVTFEYDTPSEDEFAARIRAFSAEFPFIVCEIDGEIVGYAYAHKYGERFSFRYSAELSVYAAESHCGKGIGRVLYGALIELLGAQGYKNLYALVAAPNPASFALHKAFGFREVGRANGVGYKFGKWIDLVTLERIVGEKNEVRDSAKWRECPLTTAELGDKTNEILKRYEKTASR